MATLSRNDSMSSFEVEDNRIDRIAGLHASGAMYTTLGWDVQYLPRDGILTEVLEAFLKKRFGENEFGLSLLGTSDYQIWAPDYLTHVRFVSGQSRCLVFEGKLTDNSVGGDQAMQGKVERVEQVATRTWGPMSVNRDWSSTDGWL